MDAILAGLLLLFLAVPYWLTFAFGGTPVDLLRAGVSTAMIGLLALRRTQTAFAAGAVAALGFAQLALAPGPFTSNVVAADPVAVMMMLYAAGRYGSRRVRWGSLVTGLAGAAFAALRLTLSDRPNSPGQSAFEFIATTLGIAGLIVACWMLGDRARTRAERLQALIDRAEELERSRDQEQRLAVVAERTRIAREMHDVVAHSLSVIIAQADGGRYAATLRPEAAVDSLATIAATGRSALAETRRLLGVLRGDATAATRPLPVIADVPELVESVRRAGLQIDYTLTGQARDLSPSLQLAAFRIIQESLTNVLKHAGPDPQARVQLDWGAHELLLTVVDDGLGAGAAPTAGTGHGLTGMRERAALYGGRVKAGPRPGGGFRVEAELPYEAPPDLGPAPSTVVVQEQS